MNPLFSILPTLIVLGILILIHELGHFLACRLTGVNVEKFSIGFGPEIFHWQSKRTRYAISLLPLGGFVKPAGEAISEVVGRRPSKGDYLAAPLWVRIFIVVAGVLMNYFLAFVLFTAIFMVGRPVPGTTVGGFVDGYPAKESGLQPGDKIIAINQNPVLTWEELTIMLTEARSETITLQVERAADGRVSQEVFEIVPKVESIRDIFGAEHRISRVGITPNPEASIFERYGFLQAMVRASETEWMLTVMTHKAIFFLIMGKMSMKSIAGPIGIVALTGSATELGLPYVLQMMATLSVSLAVINLLPIPALDGGHLLFLLIEGIRRKQVSLEVQEKATQVGFVMLMALMVFVIYNDFVNFDIYGKILQIFQRS